MTQTFIVLAALFGMLGVGAGAFGAHALSGMLEQTGRADTFETAVRYQMFHALALFGVALYQKQIGASALLNGAGIAFIIGIVIFSGSLYILIFTGVRWLGAITPIGGVGMIIGWILLAIAAWQS